MLLRYLCKFFFFLLCIHYFLMICQIIFKTACYITTVWVVASQIDNVKLHFNFAKVINHALDAWIFKVRASDVSWTSELTFIERNNPTCQGCYTICMVMTWTSPPYAPARTSQPAHGNLRLSAHAKPQIISSQPHLFFRVAFNVKNLFTICISGYMPRRTRTEQEVLFNYLSFPATVS